MKKRLLLIPFIALFSLTSCDFLDEFFKPQNDAQNKDDKKDDSNIAVTGVNISLTSINIEEEQNQTLEYTVSPSNATNKKVTWSSSSASIASVSNGVVYAHTPGEAIITVTTDDGNFTDECLVNVTEKPSTIVNVTGVNLIKNQIEIEVGVDEVIQYSVFPTNATNKNVTWNSSDISVATIENGVVHAVAEGQTTITVKTVDGNKTDTCLVKVLPTQPIDDDPDKNGQFYGGLVEGSEYSGYEFSKSKDEIVKPSSGIGDINVYAFNDFHGSILKQTTGNGNEVGLKQLATFYKEKSQEDNTLIFDQGDTWQGSFESNLNHGGLIQDVLTYAGVTARTVGNHDFDWGLSQLAANSSRTYNDDYIPTLAANVFDSETRSIQQNQLGKQYCTYVLDNGIKVGVVGVIGHDQITSISSQLVTTIMFSYFIGRAKEIADFLRSEKECDVVIASTHQGDFSEAMSEFTSISSNTGKRYFDLVLGGHDHRRSEDTYNGVKFVKWNAYGLSTGKVSLKYDFSSEQLVDSNTTVDTYYPGYYDQYYPVCDPVIENMVDTYVDSLDEIGDEVLSTNFSGHFDDNSLARLMTEAIYDRVSDTVPGLQFACCNYARTDFSGSVFTYRDLYKCFPFDNQIILVNVNSSAGVHSISTNFSYREDTTLEPIHGDKKYYYCAIVDYVALHKNTSGGYDRFPDVSNNNYTVFNDTLGDPPIYRDILYSYLKANPTKSFNASDYSTSNPHFVG